MSLSVPIDLRDISVTPVFMHVSYEDINASEREGHEVRKIIEAVQVRFAGSNNYAPVFPVDAVWKREGSKAITYAERWADQYRAFKEGNEQRADGTPLEMLRPYGISDSQLSLCRVMKIYSIESLNSLEGPALKSLGMHVNDLKRMASAYLADRAKGSANSEEIALLKAEIERLKGTIPPLPSPEETMTAIMEADRSLDDMTDSELRDYISGKRGGPLKGGNYSRETLLTMAKEAA